MVFLKELSPIQKKTLDKLIQKADNRFNDLQSQYNHNSSPQKLIETRSIPDHEFPADNFVKMVSFMIRQAFYGYKIMKKQGDLKQQHLKVKKIQTVYKHMNFLYEKFYFSKIDSNKPRIKTFQPKKITKDLKDTFRRIEIISKIQQLAKNVHMYIEDYVSQQMHQRLKVCDPSERIAYINPLCQILQQIQKNYPWERWKKQQILISIKDYKSSANRKKELSQLNMLQIQLISELRDRIGYFSKKNENFQKCVDTLFKQVEEEQKINKLLYPQKKNPDVNKTQPVPKQKLKQPLTCDINTQQFVGSIQGLTLLQNKLNQHQDQFEDVSKQQINEFRYGECKTKRINQTVSRQCQNLELFDYYVKKQKHNKILQKLHTIYQKQIKAHN